MGRGTVGGYAAEPTKLRIRSGRFPAARPTARASITDNEMVTIVDIFASPRIVWCSNPKLVSILLLMRSTAVRRRYRVFQR